MDCADNKVAIAEAGGIPQLVALLRDGTDAQKASAAVALCQLAVIDDNRIPIAKAGGIPLLVALVREGTDKQKEHAALALSALAYQCADNQIAIAQAKREAGI